MSTKTIFFENNWTRSSSDVMSIVKISQTKKRRDWYGRIQKRYSTMKQLSAAGQKMVGGASRERLLFMNRRPRPLHTSFPCVFRTLELEPFSVPFSGTRSTVHFAPRSSNLWFSTKTAEAISTTTDGAIWNKTSQRLITQEIGTMTPHNWHEAHHSLTWWTRIRTKEAVDTAWTLLDRLVKEEKVTTESFLLTEWLNWVVGAWRAICTNNSDAMTPDQVLQKLDQYSPHFLPDSRTFHMIVDVAIQLDPAGGPDFCTSILDRMHRETEFNPRVRPDGVMYSSILHAWANSGLPNAPQQAEATLRQMLAVGGEMAPTNMSFTTVIHAWAKSGQKDAPQRAEAILQAMQDLSSKDVYPDTIAFSVVLNTWTKSDQAGAAKRAEAILNHMESMYKDGNANVKPNVYSYATVIAAYAKVGQARDAERVLQRLQNEYQETRDDELRPNVVAHTSVIDAWSKSREPGAARRAEAVLVRMQELAQETGDVQLMPGCVSFTAVLHAWAQSGEKHAPQRAEAILQQMQDLYKAGNVAVKPNVRSYTTLLDCLAKSKERNSAKRAEGILQRMQDLYQAGDVEMRPDTFAFSAVLNAVSKSARVERDAPERAEAILNTMQRLGVKPNKYSFTSVMNTWATCGRKEAPKRVEEIIRHLNQLWLNGERQLKPSTFQYNVLINAWARVGHAVAAEAVLKKMDTEASQGNNDVRPDQISFNSVVAAWAKHGDVRRAEAIVRRMQELYEAGDTNVKPDTFAFTSVVNALSRSRDPAAVQRAMRYFDHMKKLEAAGHSDCRPNTITYTAVIRAWACSNEVDAVEKARGLLIEMHDRSKKGDRHVEPNTRTYGSLLKVIASSNLPDKAERAKQLLHEMSEYSLEPSIHEYNDVLHSCTFIRGDDTQQEKAFRIAQQTFDVIHGIKRVEPVLLTYTRFFQACANTLDDTERTKAIEEGYRRCCENGFGSHPELKKTLERFVPSQAKIILK